MFQLALPRRERRTVSAHDEDDLAVSTRAPAKGATLPRGDEVKGRGEFQLALPRRERHHRKQFGIDWRNVSTRAPAKGATRINF